jgi:hypothetical protein
MASSISMWLGVSQGWGRNPVFGIGWDYVDVLQQNNMFGGIKDVRASGLDNYTQLFATRGGFGVVGALVILCLMVGSFGSGLRENYPEFAFAGVSLTILFALYAISNDILVSLPLTESRPNGGGRRQNRRSRTGAPTEPIG